MPEQEDENPESLPANRKASYEEDKVKLEKEESLETQIYREVAENVAMQAFFKD